MYYFRQKYVYKPLLARIISKIHHHPCMLRHSKRQPCMLRYFKHKPQASDVSCLLVWCLISKSLRDLCVTSAAFVLKNHPSSNFTLSCPIELFEMCRSAIIRFKWQIIWLLCWKKGTFVNKNIAFKKPISEYFVYLFVKVL